MSQPQQGLSQQEAARRAKTYGLNVIAEKKKRHAFFLFLSYFKNPLVITLIFASTLSYITGELKNAIIILIMVFLSVGLNFYQEYKSNKAAEKIAKKISLKATVLRDGKKEEIAAKYIVPGDIVCLSAGDIVPADGEVISADDFFINEAAITGESFPVEKSFKDNKGDEVYSGTNVISGYAQILIKTTGKDTEFGKIAQKIVSQREVNAFEKGVQRFSSFILKVIIVIISLIFIISTINHKSLLDSFIFAIAIAVGLTPELLPLILSINMAKGSINMSKKGVLVKRLNAIPDFGSMDVLCTDKTGTLTEDKIALIKHLDCLGQESDRVFELAYVNGFFETGIKSVLDKAILEHREIKTDDLKKIDEIPYDFLRKRSSIVYEKEGKKIIITKGAPEEIFKISAAYIKNGKTSKLDKLDQIKAVYNNLSADGFRVLAVACREADSETVFTKDSEKEMILAGFLAFYDPPKKDVKETLAFMASHGVDIKILTGDGPILTKKICQDLGVFTKNMLTGDQIDFNMDDRKLAKKIMATTVFARLNPIQKEKIVNVLRENGLVVGFLGDGINDAPSLKAADIGISVENAVDVSKETADIILLQKGLKEMMEGVIEGRKVFANTIKYIMIGLSSNFGNMFSMLGAVLFLPFFPMLPTQILLNNFLYDVSQLSLPTDRVDQNYLKKPKHWDIQFIKKFMFTFGPVSSLFDFLTFFILYSVFHFTASTFQAGWFIESLASQVFVVNVVRTSRSPFYKSKPSKWVVIASFSVFLIGVIFTLPFLGKYFNFGLPPLKIYLIVFVLIMAYLFVAEIVKNIFYKFIAKI